MRKSELLVKLGVLAMALGAFIAVEVWAAKPGGGGGGGGGKCPRDINCPDIYDPVTCSNGVTYPNACYAFAACATGCGSSGGGAS